MFFGYFKGNVGIQVKNQGIGLWSNEGIKEKKEYTCGWSGICGS